MLKLRSQTRLIVAPVAALALVLSIAVVLALVAYGRHDQNRNQGTPVVAPSTLQPAPCAPEPVASPPMQPMLYKGVATGDIFDSMPAAEVSRYMTEVAELGAKLIRTDLKWDTVQPTAGGPFTWSVTDQVVDGAHQRGIGVMGILGSPPAWSVDAGPGAPWQRAPKLSGPCPWAAFEAYVEAMVTRYKGRVVSWQVLNEASALPAYHQNVPLYVEMLKRAYAIIKRVDPAARVLPSPTAAIGTSSLEEGLNPMDWYRKLYEAGAKGFFDELNVHPYTQPTTPGRYDPNGNWNHIELVYKIAEEFDDRDANGKVKRVGVSEMGWSTGGEKSPTNERYPRWEEHKPVTEDRQADFIGDTIVEMKKLQAKGIAGGICFYSLRDQDSADETDIEKHFGLAHTDWSRKKAWGVAHDYFALAA